MLLTKFCLISSFRFEFPPFVYPLIFYLVPPVTDEQLLVEDGSVGTQGCVPGPKCTNKLKQTTINKQANKSGTETHLIEPNTLEL